MAKTAPEKKSPPIMSAKLTYSVIIKTLHDILYCLVLLDPLQLVCYDLTCCALSLPSISKIFFLPSALSLVGRVSRYELTQHSDLALDVSAKMHSRPLVDVMRQRGLSVV